MTRRLVAAFVLGILCGAVVLYFLGPCDRDMEALNQVCDEEVDSLVEVCNERIGEANVWGESMFCRLREAEELMEPYYPGWRGYFPERDRRKYDAEFNCDSPEMAAVPWTEEELESNAELLGEGR